MALVTLPLSTPGMSFAKSVTVRRLTAAAWLADFASFVPPPSAGDGTQSSMLR